MIWETISTFFHRPTCPTEKGEYHQIPPACSTTSASEASAINCCCLWMLQKSWQGRNLSCLLPGFYKTQLVTIVPTLRLLSHQFVQRSFYFSQTCSCCCGMFGNFPQNCEKDTKNNIFHHVLRKKNTEFSRTIFVFCCIYSPSEISRPPGRSELSVLAVLPFGPGLWSSKVSSNWAIPCEALPNKLLKLTWFLVCKMSWHTRGKFMPATCQQNGDSWIDAFLGVQWAPPAKKL